MRTVVAYVPDLMDRSRLSGALPDARFVTSVDELAAVDDGVAVADLGRPGAIAALATAVANGARAVGFASHVDDETLAQARGAGCTALARSVFFRDPAKAIADA